jgi:glucose/arabinose dehydrogenase
MKWNGWVLFAICAVSVETQVGAVSKMQSHAASSLRMRAPRPQQFLLISSPREMKVVYSVVTPSQAAGSKVAPVVDSGLLGPEGIAVDRVRGILYIADPPSQKIFSYQLRVNDGILVSDGKQVTIVEGQEVVWVSVDSLGNLYYTVALNNEVMSVERAVLSKLQSGDITASSLQTESQHAADVAKEAAAAKLLEQENLPTPRPSLKPTIKVLYSKAEGEDSASAPAGIAADGITVYWGNGASGTTLGALIAGLRHPTEGQGVTKLGSNTNTAFGVATSSNAVFYTDKTQFVYGLKKAGGTPEKMTTQLQSPRGLAWDGDGTVFVADQAASMVYSFPSGRILAASLSRTTGLHDAFGLAIISKDDPFAVPAFAAGHFFLAVLFALRAL